MTPTIHDVNSKLLHNIDGAAVKFEQHISDDFLTNLADMRSESHRPAGDFHLACSVPVAVAEKWLREGYDIYKEPARTTMAKLKAESLQAFIATTKTI